MKRDNKDELRVVLDSFSYDFSRFPASPSLSRLCATYFRANNSKGSSPETRRKTNLTEASRLNVFLRFAADRKIDHIDESVSHQFVVYLRGTFSGRTENNVYRSFRKLAIYLIQTGGLNDFLLARGVSKAKASSMDGEAMTLADLCEDVEPDHNAHSELNRSLIKALEAFCWYRIDQLRNRQKQGFTWRDEALLAEHKQLVADADGMTRDDHLRNIVRYYWRFSDGFYNYHAQKASRHPTRTIVSNYKEQYAPDLDWKEIADYLRPVKSTLGAFMCLFALQRMNAGMILGLRQGMLKDDAFCPDRKSIFVDKNRAKKELYFGPYRIGEIGSKTIPQAWAILEEFVNKAFGLAPPDTPHRMFQCYGLTRAGLAILPVDTAVHAMQSLQDSMLATEREDFAPLRKLTRRISLKCIRTTVINVDRRSGSFQRAKKLARHKSGSTTAIYLDNPAMRSAYQDEVEQAQVMFVDLVKTASIVDPASTVLDVAKQYNLTAEVASDLMRDRFNAGYGVSFMNRNAFVVCTPLNCLRIGKWISTLEAAKDSIIRENPERWERVWLPELSLFKQAIADFPRKTLDEAKAIEGTYHLVYPEPF